MRVGLTGIAGFIGSNLAGELSAAGDDVVGVDRAAGDGWVHGDLLKAGAFVYWLRSMKPDVVVHLAAQVGRVFGEDDVANTVRENGEMTAVVARACAESDVPLVYVSTSEIYGDQQITAVDELIGPFTLPHNLYGLSKRWGEEVCRLYCPNLLILRLSMPYGPGVPPGRGRRAMDTFLWQAKHGMRIPVHRGAERSWCWVGDTVAGMRMAMGWWLAGTPGHQVFNVGRDDDPRPMLEIAQRACKLAGADDGLIVEVVPPVAQTVVKRLSTDRLRRVTGWAPRVEIDEGMARLWEWVRRFDADGHLTG